MKPRVRVKNALIFSLIEYIPIMEMILLMTRRNESIQPFSKKI